MPAATTATGIAYDRAGPRSAPSLVLLHAGVADRRMWDPQWPQLIERYDTVRIDLRGFGDSTTRPVGQLAHLDDLAATWGRTSTRPRSPDRCVVRGRTGRRVGGGAARTGSVPTTVLVGGLDLEAVRLAADDVADAIPGAEKIIWPEVAHLPSMERPDAFLALITQQLSA